MDTLSETIDPALVKFGIGQGVSRKEDPTLLRGEGRYTDDVNLPGQAYAVMVRSRHGHGTIRGLSFDAARAMPGVLGVYGPADLEARRLQAAAEPVQRQEPRRHAVAHGAAAGAGQDARALYRRARRLRRRRNGGAGQGRGRGCRCATSRRCRR